VVPTILSDEWIKETSERCNHGDEHLTTRYGKLTESALLPRSFRVSISKVCWRLLRAQSRELSATRRRA